jgi:hypothetical protein
MTHKVSEEVMRRMSDTTLAMDESTTTTSQENIA